MAIVMAIVNEFNKKNNGELWFKITAAHVGLFMGEMY